MTRIDFPAKYDLCIRYNFVGFFFFFLMIIFSIDIIINIMFPFTVRIKVIKFYPGEGKTITELVKLGRSSIKFKRIIRTYVSS